MTRRLTISVPDDVADQLKVIPERQVSQYVTEALRRRRASDDIRAALLAAGHREFAYDPAGATNRLSRARISADVREAAVTRLAELLQRPVEDVRAELDRSSAG